MRMLSRTLGWSLLSLGAASLSAHADGPAPAAPAAAGVAFQDVAARLRQHDAPLWLHLRIEADGRFALRSAVDAEVVTWTDRGAWRFAGAPEADAEALRGLEAGLADALGPEPRPAAMLDDDKHPLARLLIDVHAETPWRRVQWAVQSACARELKVWRLTFLVPGAATWVDVDLPKDRGRGEPFAPERVRVATVSLFRRDAATAAPFTRIKVRVEERLDGVEEELAEEEAPELQPAERPEPKVLTGKGGGGAEAPAAARSVDPLSIDLPAGTAASAQRTQAFERLVKYLTEPPSELPLQAEVKAPPPTGGAVPYADVIDVLVRLREAGCKQLFFEGAASPMPRKPGAGR